MSHIYIWIIFCLYIKTLVEGVPNNLYFCVSFFDIRQIWLRFEVFNFYTLHFNTVSRLIYHSIASLTFDINFCVNAIILINFNVTDRTAFIFNVHIVTWTFVINLFKSYHKGMQSYAVVDMYDDVLYRFTNC